MPDFFSAGRPGRMASVGGNAVELPILYYRDDLFLSFFSADFQRVRAAMPLAGLHPVMLLGGRAMVGIAAFNYVETSIGPYGEVAVVVPVVYGASAPPPIVPALLEARYPGFGMVVLHLPVTGTLARNAGRTLWGYPKFVADMDFTLTPEYQECRLAEEDRHILTLRVARGGFLRRDRKPLVTYSVKDGRLIKTTVAQRGSYRQSFFPGGSFLELGNHPVADDIRKLGLGSRPLQSRYYVERSGILPDGAPVAVGAGPLEGYPGAEREGRHRIVYR